MSRAIRLIIPAVGLALLAGCVTTQPMQGPVYDAREARAMNYNEVAVVIDVRPVIIQGQPSSTAQYTGMAVGTAIGGAIGNRISHGKTTGTVVGGALGAAAGSAAGEAAAVEMAKVQGVEVIVRRPDGRLQSVIQPANPAERFQPGQAVRLVQAPGGWHVSPYMQ